MAAPKLTAFETEPAEEFEDVALLLESDSEQQSSRRPPAWKDKVLKERRQNKIFCRCSLRKSHISSAGTAALRNAAQH